MNNLTASVYILMFLGCSNPKITFIVQVPKSTDQVTITGNLPQLGNWNPTKVNLQKVNNNEFSITLALPINTSIEYKLTKGSWQTEALTDGGHIPSNYHITFTKDTTINHIIPKWKDYNIPFSTITGLVKYHRDFYSPQLNNSRDLIVWLPPNYNTKISKRYPVVYLHDGQNVFDPSTSYLGIDWQLDETVTNLINSNKINEIIMVALYCTNDRSSEYSPRHNGNKYSKFLIKTVKPFIDSTYRTLKDAKNTAVMGSSMGGIISFHLAWEYPEIFSMAGCLSPAFLVDNSEIVKRVKKSKKERPIKLVIINGTVDLEAELQPAITKMVNVLKDKEFENIIYEIFEDAKHNESAWAKQVEIPLLYFFGT